MSKITCDEVLQDLERYIDGELDPPLAERLAVHLAGCSPCLHRAEFKAKLRELVGRKCRQELPQRVMIRIRAAIRAERIDPP